MSYAIATVFGDFQCLQPSKALELLSRGQISEIFLRKANSYTNPTGRAWGTGFCLLYGRDVKELNTYGGTEPFRFRMSVTDGSRYESISLQKAYMLRAICLNNGFDGKTPSQLRKEPRFFSPSVSDPDAIYLVEFVDERYFLAKFSSIAKSYNVRNVAKLRKDDEVEELSKWDIQNYYYDSLYYADPENDLDADGELWTWEKMIDDIWSELPFNSDHYLINNFSERTPRADYPTIKPENFQFHGVTAWEALHTIIDLIGGVLSFYPDTNIYQLDPLCIRQKYISVSKGIEPIGDYVKEKEIPDPKPVRGELTPNVVKNATELDARRTFDYETSQYSTAILPAKFNVYFHRQERFAGTEPDIGNQRGVKRTWLPNNFHLEQVTTTGVQLFSSGDVVTESDRKRDPWPKMTVVSGTEEPVWHFRKAFIMPDGSLENETELTEWATEYVKHLILTRLGDHAGKVIYTGIPFIARPGTEIKSVCWRDYGDSLGLVTECYSTPGPTNPQPSSMSGWAWSAMLGMGGNVNALGGPSVSLPNAYLPSRNTLQAPNIGQHTYPVYPQPIQLVMVVRSSNDTDEDPEDPSNETPVADCGKGITKQIDTDNFLPGVVLRLDPTSLGNDMEWNKANSENYEKPACRIVIPGLKKDVLKNASTASGLFGQIFMAKLQGSTPDGYPIFVVHHFHDFICGTLDGNLVHNGGADVIGDDGNTYRVSGKFVPEDKKIEAGAYVGFHAHIFCNGNGTDVSEYWLVIASNKCPIDA